MWAQDNGSDERDARRIEELEAEVERLRAEVEVLSVMVTSREAEVERLRAVNEEYHKAHRELRDENEQLREELRLREESQIPVIPEAAGRRGVMSDRSKMVEVSTELLAEMHEWSEPVEVRVEADRDGVLEMTFRRSAEVERLRERVHRCGEAWQNEVKRLQEEVKNAVYYRECRDKWREQAESRQAEVERLQAENMRLQGRTAAMADHHDAEHEKCARKRAHTLNGCWCGAWAHALKGGGE
jgi:hypothetical protein